jgi:hypothetical protein
MKFADLKNIASIAELTEAEQIDIIGNLLDLSFDNKSIDGINHAFELSRNISIENLSDENFTLLNYNLSNGWNYLRKLKYQNTCKDWNFQMEELTKEIFHLRKAISSSGFQKVIKERQCQIYTNIANSFSYIGRFVEAQDYWNKAINILPQFSMALGNKANGLFYYALELFDKTHQNIFIAFSFHYLRSALELKDYLHISAETGIKQLYDYLEPKVPNEYKFNLPDLNDYNLGEDEELINYRKWCLEKQLFINPLNDLGNFSIASHDCLNLPTVMIEFKRPPIYLNLYNQIKQEFATARFAFYESVQRGRPHFSDLDVELVETMETIKYSFYIEQLKISFRLSYSILDKIAYLLNDYLKLGIKPSKVSFRTLWHSNPQNNSLNTFFVTSDNWALRGLYWLSKDLYEKENNYHSVLEPEAKEIALIRNFIEHKGFKVISNFKLFSVEYDEREEISYTITRSDFENKTFNILKLARAAIMYLSFGISHEEKKKDYSNLAALPVFSTLIPNYMRI